MSESRELFLWLLSWSHGAAPVAGACAGVAGLYFLFRGAGLVRGLMGLAGGAVLGSLLASRGSVSVSGETAVVAGALIGFVSGGFLPAVARGFGGAALVALALPEMRAVTGGTETGELLSVVLGAAIGVHLGCWLEAGVSGGLGTVAIAFCGEVLVRELHPLTSLLSLSLGVLPPGPGLSPSRVGALLLLGVFALALGRQGRRVSGQV